MADSTGADVQNWTTEDAAEHYADFKDNSLIDANADLQRLAGQGIADVEVALPAMAAELAKRGLS